MSLLVSIEHSFEELGVILTALAERPFKEVAGLIAKIHMSAQAAQQAAAAPAPAPAPAEPAAADEPPRPVGE